MGLGVVCAEPEHRQARNRLLRLLQLCSVATRLQAHDTHLHAAAGQRTRSQRLRTRAESRAKAAISMGKTLGYARKAAHGAAAPADGGSLPCNTCWAAWPARRSVRMSMINLNAEVGVLVLVLAHSYAFDERTMWHNPGPLQSVKACACSSKAMQLSATPSNQVADCTQHCGATLHRTA